MMKPVNINAILYASFCGTGKSYLCNNFPDICIELECWEYRKGDFPNNYIQDVLNIMGKIKYLFISTDPVILKALNKLGIDIKLFYPKNELRSEYLDRFIDRDSPEDFIGAIMKNWYKWLNELEKQNYCDHTVLNKGEYLRKYLKLTTHKNEKTI